MQKKELKCNASESITNHKLGKIGTICFLHFIISVINCKLNWILSIKYHLRTLIFSDDIPVLLKQSIDSSGLFFLIYCSRISKGVFQLKQKFKINTKLCFVLSKFAQRKKSSENAM